MAKIKDILGNPPPFHIENFPDGFVLDPTKMWVCFDAESDSVIIYFNGIPQPSVSVYIDNNLYVRVDPKTRKVVGLHFENWERSVVPAYNEIQSVWSQVKRPRLAQQSINALLRMIALWMISVLRLGYTEQPILQTA